ncbi:MAG: aminoacyl-tRNA hydrolase [bacterium]
MKLFIGIGNPDNEFLETRHNIGKKIINDLARDFSVELEVKNNLGAEIAIIGSDEEKNILANSLSFMNDSGWPVKAIAGFYKISLEDIWVIHDEFDIPLGEIRENFDSSSAGHNGIKSIIKELGCQKFNRVRIGIKPEKETREPLEDFVLKKFRKEEEKKLEETVEKAKKIISCKLEIKN